MDREIRGGPASMGEAIRRLIEMVELFTLAEPPGGADGNDASMSRPARRCCGGRLTRRMKLIRWTTRRVTCQRKAKMSLRSAKPKCPLVGGG
jgi:hypothetical protein